MPGTGIGIVGGGLTGLALARYLSADGHRVTVFEHAPQLGGLATYHNFGPFVWDRFYHVVLPSDRDLIGFFHDLGLGERLRWRRTLTGLYIDREFFSLSSGAEFLRFPKLGPLDKARLAATILYCSRLTDWRRLEHVTVSDWLIKTCGRRTFEKLWRPLLLAKLGDHYRQVSAVFIWSYIKRMFSARDASAQREQLGYVEGGYKTVLDTAAAQIRAAGGTVYTATAVRNIEPAPGGGLTLSTDDARARFDKVIFTGPANVLQRITDPRLAAVGAGAPVEYLGVACATVLSERPLVPYYVTNIADPQVPFTGLIGMSNLIAADQTAGLHLSYLPKYVHASDALLGRPDAELRELFLKGLRRLLPDVERCGLRDVSIQRAARVQPLQTLDYSRRVPQIVTRHPDFFVLNTTRFVNNTLNNNEVIKLVRGFLTDYGPRLYRPAPERDNHGAPTGTAAKQQPARVRRATTTDR